MALPRVNAVIVGSGAGGGVVFAELARAGLSVVCLEKGRWHSPFEERKDGSVRIEQLIQVERDGQRAIILGKGGQTLKWIGTASREELTELLDRKVHLFLHVSVRETWADERQAYTDMGLDFDV